MILYIIYLIGGLLIGSLITDFIWRYYIHKISHGVLRYVREDPDSDPYLLLDLDHHPDEIKKHKVAVFMVDPKEIAPHK